MGTHNTRNRSLSHSPLSCSLQSPSPCKPTNLLNHTCPCVKTLSELRAWSVNSSGSTSIINLSSPTLQGRCLVSWIPVSATFLAAPARFQSRRPLELLDWWLGQAGAKEPWGEQAGHHRTVFWVLFWTGVSTLWTIEPRPGSLEGRTNSPGMATGSAKAPGPLPSQAYPSGWKRKLITTWELPGREQQLRKPGDLGEGRHWDRLWMIVSA